MKELFTSRMITLVHTVSFLVMSILNKCWQRFVSSGEETLIIYSGTAKLVFDGISFDPAVHFQRQEAVYKILTCPDLQFKLKKVVDFGCGGFDYFKLLKSLPVVREILEVDKNAELLESSHYRVAVGPSDFLSRRSEELNVKVLCGSISDLDIRLFGADAVICVEVIEHLYPEILECVPYTIFGYIKPCIAIFTTPNRDFNILFDMKTLFRDNDHKFEWSRNQFKCWGENIVMRYEDYDVKFYGIAKGPEGTEVVGCCSQMAVFRKKESFSVDTNDQLMCEGELVYDLIAEYVYPANRIDADRDIIEEVWEILQCIPNEERPDYKISLSALHCKIKNKTISVFDLQCALNKTSWKTETDALGEVILFPFAEHSSTEGSDDGVEEEDESLNYNSVADVSEDMNSVWETDGQEELDWDVSENIT